MVVKPEQDRVRTLLTDTVTLLCKNGLTFSKEMKVQGTLGITLDENDVLLIHINEVFAEVAKEIPTIDFPASLMLDNNSESTSSKKRRKRRGSRDSESGSATPSKRNRDTNSHESHEVRVKEEKQEDVICLEDNDEADIKPHPLREASFSSFAQMDQNNQQYSSGMLQQSQNSVPSQMSDNSNASWDGSSSSQLPHMTPYKGVPGMQGGTPGSGEPWNAADPNSMDPLYKVNYVPNEQSTPLHCTYHGCEREYKTRKTLRNHMKVKHAEWFFAGNSELFTPAGGKRPTLPASSSSTLTPTLSTAQPDFTEDIDDEAGDANTAFLCNIDNCGASFSNYNALTKHNESAHSLETRHLCAHPGCDRSFAHRQSMYRHQREQHKSWVAEHGGVPIPAVNSPRPGTFSNKLPCPFAPPCRSTFTTRSSLRRHLRNFHSHQIKSQEQLDALSSIANVTSQNGQGRQKLGEDDEDLDYDDDDEEDDDDDEGSYDDEEDEEARYLEEEKLEQGIITEGDMKVTADDGTLELETCLDDDEVEEDEGATVEKRTEDKEEDDDATIMDLDDEDVGTVLDLEGEEDKKKSGGDDDKEDVILDLDDDEEGENKSEEEEKDAVVLGSDETEGSAEEEKDEVILDLDDDTPDLDGPLREVTNDLDLGQLDTSELNLDDDESGVSFDLGAAGNIDF